MLKVFSGIARRLQFLARESQETKVQIAMLSEKVQQVTAKVQTLTAELEQEREVARRDWQKITLQMQRLNELIKQRMSDSHSQTQAPHSSKDSE